MSLDCQSSSESLPAPPRERRESLCQLIPLPNWIQNKGNRETKLQLYHSTVCKWSPLCRPVIFTQCFSCVIIEAPLSFLNWEYNHWMAFCSYCFWHGNADNFLTRHEEQAESFISKHRTGEWEFNEWEVISGSQKKKNTDYSRAADYEINFHWT